MVQQSHPANSAEQQPRSSRSRIVEQSLELFSTRGYNGVSMNDIAQAVGITKAALYYHFENKESLFLDVIRTKTADLTAELEQIISAPGDIETLLRNVALFLLDDGLGEYRQLQSDLFTVVPEERRREAMKESHYLLHQLILRIRDEQAAGRVDPSIDLDDAVPLFFSMIGGQIRRFALGSVELQRTESNDRLADLIVRIWLHGTRAPHSPKDAN